MAEHTEFRFSDRDLVRAARALWESHNPDTSIESLELGEREAAWRSILMDAATVLQAVGVHEPPAFEWR